MSKLYNASCVFEPGTDCPNRIYCLTDGCTLHPELTYPSRKKSEQEKRQGEKMNGGTDEPLDARRT